MSGLCELEASMTVAGLAWRVEGWLLRVLLAPLYAILWAGRVRFLRLLYDHVGHLASDPDTLLKELRLGLRPPCRVVLVVDGRRTANAALLDYWRAHFTIVTHPLLCRILTHLLYHFRSLDLDIWRYHCQGGEAYAIPEIWGRYQRSGGGPLLQLREEHRRRGREVLLRWGLGGDDWFVCFHARSGGYRMGDAQQDFRNVSPERFDDAREAVLARGGWCVIMGDATMPRRPGGPRVIDYAHGSERADWLDVFLCAACRFFLGSNSGLMWVPRVFGRPTAITNCVPLSNLPGMGDLVLPKWYRDAGTGRRLTLDEVLTSPAAHAPTATDLAAHGLTVEENDARDIADLAGEMLDRLEGRVRYTAQDERLQARYRDWTQGLRYGRHAEGRMGRDFLRRNAAELFATAGTHE